MASKDYYSVLWISKGASSDEIKKAFRKKAMEWHPDKHKWDKKAEEKFKEINEAYQVLWDAKKRKQYDTFWQAWDFSWFSWQWWAWFEDIFSQFWRWQWSSSAHFDMWDLFSNMFSWWQSSSSFNFEDFWQKKSKSKKEEEPKLDIEEVREIPIMDFILWTKINIRTVYNKNLSLKIPELTKPWTKFKIKWKWRSSSWKTGDLYIKVEAKMPKSLPDDIKNLLESIKYRI